MDRRPDWILLSTAAVAGRNSNSNATTTTATGCTWYGTAIEVSLSLQHPPRPSLLHVHSSSDDMNLNPCVPANIVCAEEDLLLVTVNIASASSSSQLLRYIRLHLSAGTTIQQRFSPNQNKPNLQLAERSHFIYQAHHTSRPPSLQWLQRPHDPYFNYNSVALLPGSSDGGGSGYAVAALIPTFTSNQYKLYVLHSHTQSWSCTTLLLEAPQEPFPMVLPRGSTRLHRHLTSGVITIGGEGGTIGWVDHWRGILFCDVLLEKPSLRGVPLPMPLKELRDANGEDFPFGPGWQRRGIAFSRDKVLKLVHLEVTATRLPHKDPETGSLSFRVHGWALTTWSNTRMTSSYKDWHEDCTVHASDLIVDDPDVSQALQSGLLLAGEGEQQLALQNLVMSQPTQCMDGEEDVICLVARRKHYHPAAWILTVDMKNAKVQAVEEFGATGRPLLHSSVMYYPSMISQYI